LPRETRECSEDAVLYVIDHAPHLIPSFELLSGEMQDLVKAAFYTHSRFNLAQFLQGENCPSHVQQLQECIQYDGEGLLAFYLFNLLGMMCALRGSETQRGALFMDQRQGTIVVMGIQCLQQLSDASSHAIYWAYVNGRARSLRWATDTPESLAVARLACLIRAVPKDMHNLESEWNKLSVADRNVLVEHFLHDGIQEKAIVFAYLPVYMVAAKANTAIGIHRALAVLIDFLELLRADGCVEQHVEMTFSADLTDVAAFVREVHSPRVFDVVAGFSKIAHTSTGVKIEIAAKHWSRVSQKTWQEDPLQEMSHVLRKIERKTDSFEKHLDAAQTCDAHASERTLLSRNKSCNGIRSPDLKPVLVSFSRTAQGEFARADVRHGSC